MKKLILIILMTTTTLYSQEQANTITVIGEANKTIDVNNYWLTITLKELTPDGYQQLESVSLEQIKKMYSDKLKSQDIDFSVFKENDLLYLYSAYSETSKNIAYYTYTTTSQEDMKKIIGIRMNGLTINSIEVLAKEQTNDELAALTKIAVEDAILKANKIVSKLDKKISGILTLEDSNTQDSIIDIYKPAIDQKHRVKVVFKME